MKLGVLVYIERSDGHVLMIHRQKHDEHLGFWLAPGGKLERNEAPDETAIREVLEETGLHVPHPKMKAVLSFPDLGDSPFGDEWHVFVFHATEFSGELLDVSVEGTLHWVPRQKLIELPMWEGDRLFTPRIFENDFFYGKLVYRGQTLVEASFSKD
ncbi:MAG: 8-oxo-dGTP diphosphatase [SAR324 cluster bacterium]|nr:8-oxo-dGTP diphosphatase [SAR324 cluster bacterium]